MIDSSTRRPSGEKDAPRVFERPRPAVTEFSRHGSRTHVSQEYATHSGAAATSLGGARAAARRGAGRSSAAARPSRRAVEAGEKPVRHNATARLEAVQEAKDRAVGVAESAGGFFAAHKLVCIIVGTILVAAIFLYGPAATYYRAWRAGLDLQAQYDALAQSNDQIQQQNDALLTRDGIEEEARRRGYVGEGETGVIVEGLPDDSSDGSDATADYPWFVGIGDALFGYEAQ